jgi:RHS repeat-associated protein
VFVTDADNREVMEYSGANGQILRWYAYGLGTNDVLNQMNVPANTRATFIPDTQGSTIGTVAATLTTIGYLPYGKSASAAGPFGYTGQRIDPETNGLHYYRSRMYAPAWGRFMQPDRIGYGGGSNLYAYVNNDPLNNTDPNGQFCIPCAFAIGGAAVGLAIQGYHDYQAGQLSSFGNYAGSATAGAIGGLSLLAGGIGTAVVIGSGGAILGNTAQQTIDIATGAQQGYNVTSAVVATAAGGVMAGVLKPFSGVIASEYGPISQGLITKYANGTISQAAPQTVGKMFGTELLEENVIPGAILEEKLNDVANQILPSVTIGGSDATPGAGTTPSGK